PVDRHVPRGLDPQADLAAVDVHDGNADVVADVNLFAQFAAQDQHLATLLRAKQWLACTSILLHSTMEAVSSRRTFFPPKKGFPPSGRQAGPCRRSRSGAPS